MHPESRDGCAERALPRRARARPPSRTSPGSRAARASTCHALAAVLRGALRSRPLEAAKEAVVFAEAVALARIVARDRVAHVHAHFASHPATAAWIVHRLTGVPFSFTAHANDLFLGPVLLERKAADARFVVAISEYNRRLLLDRCPARRVEVVHCGVDSERSAWRGRRREIARSHRVRGEPFGEEGPPAT